MSYSTGIVSQHKLSIHPLGVFAPRFRLNPYQKTEILDLKQKFGNGVSIAIGDGGNDAQATFLALNEPQMQFGARSVGVAWCGVRTSVA